MKRYIRSVTTPYEYNQNQTYVGSPLKTLKGNRWNAQLRRFNLPIV